MDRKPFHVLLFLLLLTMCSLTSVNAQGLRSSDRRQAAFRFFQRHRYDIIFLQETHWTDDLFSTIKRDWNGDLFCNNGTDSSRGVAILISPHFNYTHINTSQDSSGRILSVTIHFDDNYLHLVNLYAPNSDTERRQFFSTLDPYLSSTYNNIIGGDFNCIENPVLDKQGGNSAPRQNSLRILHLLTSQFNLTDIWRLRNPYKRAFTWTGRDTRTAHSFINTRIDRFYTSHTLTPYVSESSIVAYPHSDHDLILLTLDLDRQPRGPGYWHFNNTLLNDAIFELEIKEFWTQWRSEQTSFPSPLEWWEKAKHQFKRVAIKRSTTLRKLERSARNELERNLHYLKQQATTGSSRCGKLSSC